jgi:RimJ/RimL family protein N-acetyltransferase
MMRGMQNPHILRRDVSYSLPIPVYESTVIGTLETTTGENLAIHAGLDRSHVEQLRAKSLDDSDTAIQENTSDRERFGTGSYEGWYSKGRVPFALVSDAGLLAAIVWLGPKPLGRKSLKYLSEEEKAKELSQKASEWHTLVYRSYAPFRGMGLMRPFVRFCIDEYSHLVPSACLWVGMSASNEASARLAQSLGFKKREGLYDAEKNWQGMVLD